MLSLSREPVRLLQQITLYFQQGASDKVYEVDLCQAGEDEFLVNFRYGRRGTRLREGTKTPFPETRVRAEAIFNQLVQSKKDRGYHEAGQAPAASTASNSPPPAPVGDPTDPRHTRVAELLRAPSETWRNSRVLWRAGEFKLASSLPDIIAAPEERDLDAYAKAWTLGRLADPAARSKLQELRQHRAPMVQRMATEALASCADAAEKETLFAEVKGQLTAIDPNALQDSVSLNEAVRAMLHNGTPPHDDLYRLYFLGLGDPMIREVVYQTVRGLPFHAPFFRPIRYIFKAAEFRLDAEMFGMLARRFEKDPAGFINSWGYTYDRQTYESIEVSEELRKPNSRLAYSDRTKEYLRQRLVRNLDRAADAEDIGTYITLSTGILMAFDDAMDEEAPRSSVEWVWNGPSGEGYVETKQDSYGRYIAFNHILYGNSNRYQRNNKGTAWVCANGYQPGQPTPDRREESHPEFWDRAPDALQHLLSHSKAGRVHEFAVKVWRANSSFSDLVDADFVLALLSQRYEVTQKLGLDLARAAYDPNQPDLSLIVAVLSSSLPEAHELGLQWLRADERLLLGDPEFTAELLLIPHDTVHLPLRELLSTRGLPSEFLGALLPKVIAGLLELEPEDSTASDTVRRVRETLLIVAGSYLGEVHVNVARDLINSPITELQLLGAQILLQRQGDTDSVPDDILFTLLKAEAQSVRSLGMQIFGRLSDAALLDRSEILASLCISEASDMRAAARPIMERLAGINPGFAQDMVLQFYPMLMRKEPYEGLHDDVYALLEGPLGNHLEAIPRESCFRMLQSRYRGGQLLGLLILKRFVGLDGQPMSRLVMIADNEPIEGREYVWDYFQSNVDVIRGSKEEALRMLDSSWEDTRAFSLDYFRSVFVEADWTPELLVSICDSTRPEIQDFGRELITRFFQTEHGPEYLLKLSQHPTAELQMFASNYLERFAADDVNRLRELEHYFLAVLTQVNRGRVAKDRVLRHLEREALKSAEAAAFVMSILDRQSVTMAIQDKAALIRAMHRIQKTWPEQATPLQPKAFPTEAAD